MSFTSRAETLSTFEFKSNKIKFHVFSFGLLKWSHTLHFVSKTLSYIETLNQVTTIGAHLKLLKFTTTIR